LAFGLQKTENNNTDHAVIFISYAPAAISDINCFQSFFIHQRMHK